MRTTSASPTPSILVVVAALLTGCGRASPAAEDPPAPRVLRVCADPNNLPFSNAREEGFENRIAELLARELGATLAYEWRPQRRGFLRTGVNRGSCDVTIGLPSDHELALTTRPYYRSSYVFVRAPGTPPIASFDDPALRALRIGVQIIGDDYANSPPVHALARRGLASNLVGYTVYGDYAQDSPPAEVIRAVARGEVDVAIAWGPLAGYHARRGDPVLAVQAVAPAHEPGLPMRFEISLAVKRGRTALRAELDTILREQRAAIDAILDAYAVPRV